MDDSTKAFTELVALRDTVQQFLVERASNNAEREGARTVIKYLNEAITSRDNIAIAVNQLIIVYDKVIQVQSKLIEDLQKQLNKPKGFFQSLLDKVKQVALIATGLLIGKGL